MSVDKPTSTPPAMTQSGATTDAAQLLTEIEEDVRRKRASGELPLEFERELDRAFAALAPVDAEEVDLETILARPDPAATIDTKASTWSSRRGVAQVKQVVAKAIDWDLRHVATQVTVFAHGVVRALKLLDRRVESLEQAVSSAAGESLTSPLDRQASALPPGPWAQVVVEAMRGVSGRILHAECGDGTLVRALESAGLDGYGVQPGERTALAASDLAVDVRSEDTFEHLSDLAPGSLGGLVLSGSVERLTPSEQVGLTKLAASRLGPAGVLAIISVSPAAWTRARSPVITDLAAGRPLHAETWVAILSSQGFSSSSIHDSHDAQTLTPVAAESPEAETLNGNIRRLNELFFGPTAYAVTASR